jgi:thioredoxin-like negative regulator of GroEL
LETSTATDAVVYLRQANRIHPENFEIRHQLALAYLQSGQAAKMLDLIAEPKTDDDHALSARQRLLSGSPF